MNKTKIRAPQYDDNAHPNYLRLTILRPHRAAWRYAAFAVPHADAGVDPDDMPSGKLVDEELWQRLAEDIQRIAEYLAHRSEPHYSVQNDGIGDYVYWGSVEVDHGEDYLIIEGNRDVLPSIYIDLPLSEFKVEDLGLVMAYIDVELQNDYPSQYIRARVSVDDDIDHTAQLRPHYSIHITQQLGTMQLEINFVWHSEED